MDSVAIWGRPSRVKFRSYHQSFLPAIPPIPIQKISARQQQFAARRQVDSFNRSIEVDDHHQSSSSSSAQRYSRSNLIDLTAGGEIEEKDESNRTFPVTGASSSSTNGSLSVQTISRPIQNGRNSYADYFKQLQLILREKEEQKFPKSFHGDDSIIQRINEEMNVASSGTTSADWDSDLEEMEVDNQHQQTLLNQRKEPITNEERIQVEKILAGPRNQQVLIDKFNIEMTREKFCCLSPCTWLNDEVINFYMSLLQQRDQQCIETHQKLQSSHYFNSFFFTKLLEKNSYNYSLVKRWTKKFNILEKEKIIIPVNLSNTHWTLLVIYIQKKEIHYYDSMSGAGTMYLEAALRWIVDDVKDKQSKVIERNEWKLISREAHVPQQRNGYDCGMFTIMCADYISDDLPLEYNQSEMSQNRLKVGAAILRGTLNY